MKKKLLKMHVGIVAFVALLAFGLGAVEASAQGGPKAILKHAPASWLLPNDALDVLNQNIAVMEAQMQSTPTTELMFKLKYFACVSVSIEQGQPVGTAVDVNLGLFVPGLTDAGTVEIPNPLSLATWQSNYLELVNMLKS